MKKAYKKLIGFFTVLTMTLMPLIVFAEGTSKEVAEEYTELELTVFFAILFIFFVLIPLSYLISILRNIGSKRRKKKTMQITEQSMRSFAKAIDAKDNYTKGHSQRVAKYSVEIAKRYGLAKERCEDMYYTALLHDIGKIGIPDSILKNPGRLSVQEYQQIKKHPLIGADILSEITSIEHIQLGAREHHEKYDGTGYPLGLKGENISIEGRIVGAADAYDAMTTSRGYNEVQDREHTRNEILAQSGKQFDPVIAEILIEMIDSGAFSYFNKNGEFPRPFQIFRKGKKRKVRLNMF